MSEQNFPQPPISRDTSPEIIEAIAAQNGGITPSLDSKGNEHFYPDDAAEANAHYAAERGVWEKWAQPGFEESAKKIALDAQIETAHEDALWEDHEHTRQKEDDKDLDEYYAGLDAEQAAAEKREHEAYLRGDDETTDLDGDLEARCGITNQEAIAASYDDEAAEPGHEQDDHYSTDEEELRRQEEDEQTEDPLEGDVDRFVPPEETADPSLAWGNHARAAREHGDITES